MKVTSWVYSALKQVTVTNTTGCRAIVSMLTCTTLSKMVRARVRLLPLALELTREYTPAQPEIMRRSACSHIC